LPVKNSEPISKKRCNEKIKNVQEFNLKLRDYNNRLNLERINEIRKNFKTLLV